MSRGECTLMTANDDEKWLDALSGQLSTDQDNSQDVREGQALRDGVLDDFEKQSGQLLNDGHDEQKFLFKLREEKLLDPDTRDGKTGKSTISINWLSGIAAILLIAIAVPITMRFIDKPDATKPVSTEYIRGLIPTKLYVINPADKALQLEKLLNPLVSTIKRNKYGSAWYLEGEFKIPLGEPAKNIIHKYNINVSRRYRFRIVIHSK